jgi:hypothetical protein
VSASLIDSQIRYFVIHSLEKVDTFINKEKLTCRGKHIHSGDSGTELGQFGVDFYHFYDYGASLSDCHRDLVGTAIRDLGEKVVDENVGQKGEHATKTNAAQWPRAMNSLFVFSRKVIAARLQGSQQCVELFENASTFNLVGCTPKKKTSGGIARWQTHSAANVSKRYNRWFERKCWWQNYIPHWINWCSQPP